ncbi:MmcQ/YjbR family DNA-binding protein [Alysiella filiformis]|uniref:Predicted DNA-binding protein, MmcQ/YjbR family n=1 Tax=Alysiella filiformis DSM 16848 TaxID=1120981 RepID=A0A286EB41_9NEIS|nr:MmcQ/YjbR family DNA-binding protein [Alysiella filiformis]QMT32218.1 MmcQ/YjbR family DNA-binding protein [Alysiella filiformis]UBQ56862.1 MmcQ/YjbR family DNA-binding protein [Alysiella filiformis DSM 16848]SOD68123.1 Predicted DNA-binding protein, MmcQ/YjbR family [Alysiella filiformis DSM 16848]
MSSQTDFILKHIAEQYGVLPEYLFRKHPTCAVFRQTHNRKWFAVMQQVSGSQIALPIQDKVAILNVKLPPEWVAQLSEQDGFAPAYHMNKRHWLTLRLDGTLPENQLLALLAESFRQTRG